MELLLNLFKERRIALGLSQVELAGQTGVSLPTIQNIEMHKANPSLETLKALIQPLGMDISLTIKPLDWDELAFCGAPLALTQDKKSKNFKPTPQRLLQVLREACFELMHTESSDVARKREAIEALFFALKTHYPTFFRKKCMTVPWIESFYPKQISGRLIRLKRQALAVLATYL